MKFFATAIACLFLVSAAHAVDRDWQTVSVNDGKLTIKMPGKPTITTKSDSSIVGDVTSKIYKVNVPDDGNVTVDCSDLPGAALFFAGKDTIFGNAKGKFLAGAFGKQLSWDSVTTSGQTGMKLMFQTPPMDGKPGYDGEARFFLVGDYLYVISVTDVVGDDLEMQKQVFPSVTFADTGSDN